MIRVLFWILLVMTVVLAVRIATILIRDLDRLTNFGYGYLTGKLILFAFFLIATIFFGLRLKRLHRNTGVNRQ